MAKQAQATKPKKKSQRSIPSGRVYVKATFNNTIVSITDPSGAVIAWSTAGKSGFSGSRKSSAFAGAVAAKDAGKAAMAMGLKEVDVFLDGPGAGREAAVRALQGLGLLVMYISDNTAVQHNGCRPRKRRRA